MAGPLLLLDPSVLAVCDAEIVTAEDFEAALRQLKFVRACLQNDVPVSVTAFEDTASLLADSGYFPILEPLKEIIRRVGLMSVYSPQDIVRYFHSVLERASAADEKLGISEVLVESPQFTPTLSFRVPEDLLKLVETILLRVATAQQIDTTLSLRVRMASRAGNSVRTCRITGVVHQTDPSDLYVGDINQEVRLILGADDFFSSLDAKHIWEAAASEHFIALAVIVALLKAGVRLDEWQKVPQFRIGPGFVESLRENNAYKDGEYGGVVLESMVQVLLGNGGGEMWKVVGGRRQPYVRSDGARGRRRHVTRSHQAIRLMYWDKPDYIEFANVGPKSELRIDERSTDAAHSDWFLEIWQ